MAKWQNYVKMFLLGETMVICLISDLNESEKNEISNSIKVENIEDYLKVDFSNTQKIVFVSRLNLDFFPAKFIEMLSYLKLNNLTNIKIEVILVEKLIDNSKMAIEWLNELNSKGYNIKLIAELDAEDFKAKINNLISMNTFEQKKENNNEITIYTDGACSGNPGAGGWGAVLIGAGKQKEISGFDPLTTNNQMELTAVIKALEMLKISCNVKLYSDSAYVVNAINQNWLENWKNNGWVGSDKKPVKNIELWQKLDILLNKHSVKFIKVKGHADNELNNRCDKLATGEIAKHANS